MIKKIILFTFLKIIEISGIVFLPYYCGVWIDKKFLDWTFERGIFYYWATGIFYGILIPIAMISLFSIIYILLIDLIKLNWKWVNQLLEG